MGQCDLAQLQRELRQIFRVWGRPQAMKFDNGHPFSDPQKRFFPAIALWLIGLDIQVVYNRPRIPQDNAKVEKSQDTTQRWASIKQCEHFEQLESQLNQAILIQREQYPVTRLGGKTRLNAFPDLNPALNRQKRPYCAGLFDLQRVYDFLQNSSWQRKVSSKGQLGFWDVRFTLGTQYQSQLVSILMDAPNQRWIVSDEQGKHICFIKKPFTVTQICHLTSCQ